MTKEEALKIILKADPTTLRVVKYMMKEHRCSTSNIQFCTKCRFRGCSECYLKHLKEMHNFPDVKSFVEKTQTSNLIHSWSSKGERSERTFSHVRSTSKGRIRCICDEKFRSVDRHEMHMKKYHKEGEIERINRKSKRPKVAPTSINLDAQVSSLNEEELEKILAILQSKMREME